MQSTKKLIILIIIVLAIPYPAWYGVNYYSAGLVDQTQLIEFGMQEDFVYCQNWRPDLLDVTKTIKHDTIDLPILHYAAKFAYMKIINRLLKDGIDTNLGNSNNHGALHLASYHGHSDVVRLLLKKGVNINNPLPGLMNIPANPSNTFPVH